MHLPRGYVHFRNGFPPCFNTTPQIRFTFGFSFKYRCRRWFCCTSCPQELLHSFCPEGVWALHRNQYGNEKLVVIFGHMNPNDSRYEYDARKLKRWWTIEPFAALVLNLVQKPSWDFLLKRGREQSPEIDIPSW